MQTDFVILGGGSAGAVLASRLSEKKTNTVTLLEAGGRGASILNRIPAGGLLMLRGRPAFNNWAFETTPQPGLNGRRGYQPRGKVLGGSSILNAMIYNRGQKQDYDAWADQGNKGWGWTEVLPYFKKSENNIMGENFFHGGDGPLEISNQKAPREISNSFVKSCENIQIKSIQDFNTGDNEGAGLWQSTIFHSQKRNGERCSASAAYLRPVEKKRPNLQIITYARVLRILFENKKAVGVVYSHKGIRKKIFSKKSIILCCGAFQSPQLLQLSGVGRSSDICPHGIKMIHELPGVGQNLQDHIDFMLAYKTDYTDVIGLNLGFLMKFVPEIFKWLRTGNSILSSTLSEAGAFFKTDPGLKRPDVQSHFVIALVDDHLRRLHYGYGYSCHVCVLRP